MRFPKVLIISNGCFNKSDSNGRTIMNFFVGYPKDKIAQFYLHGEPDFNVCKNYYQVSDMDALVAFRSFGKFTKDGLVKQKGQDAKSTVKSKKHAKTCLNRVLRDIVWRSYRWWNTHFDKFLKDFNPEVVLVQAGDSPFMLHITRKIAKKYNIPIVMYNSENYVLKKRMYSFVKNGDIWYTILKNRLKKEYRKLMKNVSYCIYNTEYLEDCYQKAYSHKGKSIALYTITEMMDCSSNQVPDIFTLLYCGNLGVGRSETLNEMAKVLKEVDDNARLVICGKFPSESLEKLVCGNLNVDYKGFVNYDEVPNIISKSTMVVHCENPERLEDLKGAFSTKIADCLACGKPFLVYALKEYPFVKYLERNNAAHIAENVEEFKDIIASCINSVEFRNKFIKNSLKLAKERHNCYKTTEEMLKILQKVTKKGN